ncbi:MAG: mismatch repair protein MutT [Microbacteriaceae bacterium]|jgi:8-oxo-dGTP pyrophosphatase MutT (NUDIX family)/phosphohistidine phosphatase SixA|nr:mismatch repair protein MutT [Microbacteriaceae bacterium]
MHRERLPANLTVSEPPLPVLAAGALCWRVVAGKALVLLVHRGNRADVSLPKGKVDPGETLPQTAVREIEEETGLAITLGAPLGTVEYTLPNGREKVVYYWSSEVTEKALDASTFKPNSEISAVEWVPIDKVRKKLSYAHDIDIVDRFEERFAAGRARTFAIIALRHGTAVPPSMWDGPDATRPLMQRGADQALSIAPAIAAFSPTKLVSSTAARCLATIAPLAGALGSPVKETETLSQDAWEMGTADVERLVAKRMAKRVSAVLCSHGPVLPEIILEIARVTESPTDSALRRAAELSTGEYAVMHVARTFSQHGIVAVETHGPALA